MASHRSYLRKFRLRTFKSIALWLNVYSFKEPFRLISSHGVPAAAFGINYGINSKQQFSLSFWDARQPNLSHVAFDHHLQAGKGITLSFHSIGTMASCCTPSMATCLSRFRLLRALSHLQANLRFRAVLRMPLLMA